MREDLIRQAMAAEVPKQREMQSGQLTSSKSSQDLTTTQMVFLQSYKNPKDLMILYTPDKQSLFARQPQRCLLGNSPTLADMRAMYGGRWAELWLENQLRDLGEYAGAKEKPNQLQLEETARMIIADAYYLKLSELMLFFAQFKVGRYGRFFGSVDPIVITEALQAFKVWRISSLEAIERAAKAEELAKRPNKDPESMTREEWEELKWMFNLGYEKDENGKIR